MSLVIMYLDDGVWLYTTSEHDMRLCFFFVPKAENAYGYLSKIVEKMSRKSHSHGI